MNRRDQQDLDSFCELCEAVHLLVDRKSCLGFHRAGRADHATGPNYVPVTYKPTESC
jgi:hypothetical protein